MQKIKKEPEKPKDLAKVTEILPGIFYFFRFSQKGRLYWICDKKPPQSQKEAYYFSIDKVFY